MQFVSTRERAEANARQLSRAHLDTLIHVVRDGAAHYCMDQRHTSGEIMVGTRLATFENGERIEPMVEV